ncbi:hypothetical protein BDN67DRAFT_909773 [Paxillus ammoniavirescens]|nr:hypothetical protein BDN67DRAFT_909773 [Paxillus ammoniavirescens]
MQTGPARQVVSTLASTSAAFLVSPSPITSSQRLPQFIPTPLTPMRKRKHDLLEVEPETEREQALHKALDESYTRELYYRSTLVGIQLNIVLQSMYCDKLSGQLAAQEERKNKKNKGGHLVSDGLPRLLTGEDFFNKVVDHQKVAEEEATVKEAWRVEREEMADLVKVWKDAEAAWLERNKERRLAYKEEVARWNTENEQAKLERRKPRWCKPKLGKLESPLPRPSVDSDTQGAEDLPDSDANTKADENVDESDDGNSDGETDGRRN